MGYQSSIQGTAGALAGAALGFTQTPTYKRMSRISQLSRDIKTAQDVGKKMVDYEREGKEFDITQEKGLRDKVTNTIKEGREELATLTGKRKDIRNAVLGYGADDKIAAKIEEKRKADSMGYDAEEKDRKADERLWKEQRRDLRSRNMIKKLREESEVGASFPTLAEAGFKKYGN